jgi:hypothetical protein
VADQVVDNKDGFPPNGEVSEIRIWAARGSGEDGLIVVVMAIMLPPSCLSHGLAI